MTLRTDETNPESNQEVSPGDVKFIDANHNSTWHIPITTNFKDVLSSIQHFLDMWECSKNVPSMVHVKLSGFSFKTMEQAEAFCMRK